MNLGTNKKISYFANIRLPTEKAHGLATMKMCEALVETGFIVELVVPSRQSKIKGDPFEFYGVKKNFRIKRLPCLDLVSKGRLGFWVESISYAISAFVYSINKNNIFYGRDEISLSLISLFKKNVFWESHTAKSRFKTGGLLNRISGLIVISRGLLEHYVSLGVDREKIVILPSGVDLKLFDSVRDGKSELREKLSLPLDKKIVAYVGKFKTMGHDKGVDSLISYFEFVTDPTIFLLVVGSDNAGGEILNGRGVVVPAVSAGLVAQYMKASDLLVANYPDIPHYSKFMSPLKIFEYMASGTPILTTDLPSIREVLNEKNSFFFPPGNIEEFLKILSGILSDDRQIKEISARATEDVRSYSWYERAKKLSLFFNHD